MKDCLREIISTFALDICDRINNTKSPYQSIPCRHLRTFELPFKLRKLPLLLYGLNNHLSSLLFNFNQLSYVSLFVPHPHPVKFTKLFWNSASLVSKFLQWLGVIQSLNEVCKTGSQVQEMLKEALPKRQKSLWEGIFVPVNPKVGESLLSAI